jgi:4-hydroxy-3-methylbut-2-en-1-yl diphosphate synthase IspG/GcpE
VIYPYVCNCGNTFEVIKPVSLYDREEECWKCGEIAKRVISNSTSFYGAKVEDAEYCPAMGCIVKNSAHRKQIAKDLGLIEVGNDSGKWFEEKQAEKQMETERFYEDLATDRHEITTE